MSINLTLTQKAKGLYVSERDTTGFEVEEIEGGTSNATFDWLIFATRKDGDGNEVIDEVSDEDEPVVEPQLVEEQNDNTGDLPDPEVPLQNEGEGNPDNVAPDPLEEAEPQPVEGEAEELVVEVLESEPVVENNDPIPEAVQEAPAADLVPAE